MKIFLIALVCCIVTATQTAFASFISQPRPGDTIDLWPRATSRPYQVGDQVEPPLASITCFPLMSTTVSPAAVLICPGGGYDNLAFDHEGLAVAKWFNEHGIAAFVLKYRIRPNLAPAALEDAQKAMRLLRSISTTYHFDPDRLGIVGFSAGGHLASTLGTHFDEGKSHAVLPAGRDPLEKYSCRPAFMLLIYPVITMKEPFVEPGSRRSLLGEHPTEAEIDEYSNELHVTDHTPPAFLLASTQDKIVPWQNSQMMADALSAHHVPVEFVKFEHGNHGFGLGGDDPILNAWPDKLLAWLREIKMVP